MTFEHAPQCRLIRAASSSVGVECEHGYDVCPICDPCTCEPVETKMTLDDLVAQVTEEKLKAGKVLVYNPGRHAPLKVSIWWKEYTTPDEMGNVGTYGVNVVESNTPGGGKTYIYQERYEAALVGFKSACERAIAMWAIKVMRPNKVH